jgi:hypothetical protein
VRAAGPLVDASSKGAVAVIGAGGVGKAGVSGSDHPRAFNCR